MAPKTSGGSQAALLPSGTIQAIAALMLTTLMLASLVSMGATVRRSLSQTAESALTQAGEVVRDLERGLEGTVVRIGELATTGPSAAVGPPAPEGSIVLVPAEPIPLTTTEDATFVTDAEGEDADLGPGRSGARGLRGGLHGPPSWARAFGLTNLDVKVRSGPSAPLGKAWEQKGAGGALKSQSARGLSRTGK